MVEEALSWEMGSEQLGNCFFVAVLVEDCWGFYVALTVEDR